MDLVLNLLDKAFLTEWVYPTWLDEGNVFRQAITLTAVLNIGGLFLYLFTATFSFLFIFDHALLRHPLILKDQIKKELKVAVSSIPLMSAPTTLVMLQEVRGRSKLYDNVQGLQGWAFIALSVPAFLAFTDACIYWIHRALHHGALYRHVHKTHHLWKVPTPYASHAFHPVDGFLQSLPYHVYPFLFPLHKVVYLLMFVVVNVWTVSIHDGDYRVPRALEPLVNGSAHHTDHHLYYSYNYGQFFTLWDRLGGSFRYPSALLGKGPLDDIRRRDEASTHQQLNGSDTIKGE